MWPVGGLVTIQDTSQFDPRIMAPHHTSLEKTAGAAQAGRRRADGAGGQAGQTLPLFVVFLVVLLGVCALAIDVGFWAQGKRATQNSADASALAGAAFLGVNWSTAQTNASSEFTKNMASGDTADLHAEVRTTSPTTRFR